MSTQERDPSDPRRAGRWLFGYAIGLVLAGAAPAADDFAGSRLSPVEEKPIVIELAPYMGELQRLTHKLSLSVGASNPRLARFYADEVGEVLHEIQREVPEYEGQPIALLVDRLALPEVAGFVGIVEKPGSADDSAALHAALDRIVESCNACHRATRHELIKITAETRANPFNQDFRP